MQHYVDSIEQLVTEIYVRDIGRSTEFYRRLGFELVRDDCDFVELAWEGNRLYLAERDGLADAPDFPQANMLVLVPNVDDYWNLVGEMGARVMRPIADKEYGQRDFIIIDPDGFGVRFGTLA